MASNHTSRPSSAAASTTFSPAGEKNTPPIAQLPSFLGGAPSATHLVVLIHGLWGKPEHMHSIARNLRARYPADNLYLHCATAYSGLRTYDGVEHGGERVCAEVEALMAERTGGGGGDSEGITPFDKISVVGYSMGGLVARYMVGLLEAKGVLAQMRCMVGFVFFSSR